MSNQIDVVGAVIWSGGKVLCVQRGAGGSLPGMWEFPGGKIEQDESPAQALEREIREELGCRIAVAERLTTTVHAYDFGTISLTTFHAQLVSGEPTLTEHAAMQWLAPADLTHLDWAPADIPSVELLRAGATPPARR